jgi:hypothetical protein
LKKTIICTKCDVELNSQISSNIKHYFKIVKNVGDENYSTSSKSSTNRFNPQELRLRLPRELNKRQKKILQRSIIKAFSVKNIKFNDDLVYPEIDCPEKKNNSSLEPGIKSLSEYNKEIYYKLKERSRCGEYAPLEIVEDEIQVYFIVT